jgi:hypothetical protein
MYEQCAVVPEGHPWLRRHPPDRCRTWRREARDRDDYLFHRIDGEEVHEVAVGPVHAGTSSPASRFQAHGERAVAGDRARHNTRWSICSRRSIDREQCS